MTNNSIQAITFFKNLVLLVHCLIFVKLDIDVFFYLFNRYIILLLRSTLADSIPDSPNKLEHNSEKGCVPCGIKVIQIY